MSIKPVDFQVMIPRTMEVSKSNSDETQKNFTLQQQQAASTQHNADSSLRQVYSQKNTQDVKINQRQKERESSNKNKKKKDGKDDGQAESRKKNIQTSTIDIKV